MDIGDLDITIKDEEHFHLSNGRVLKNLYELINALKSIDEHTFNAHVNEYKNDFGNWVDHVYKDKDLADAIHNANSKDDMIKALEVALFKEEEREEQETKEEDSVEKESHDDIKVEKIKYEEKSDTEDKKVEVDIEETEEKKEPEQEQQEVEEKQEPIQEEQTDSQPTQEETNNKLDQVLEKEKEIELREKKIQEIEERIEKDLEDLKKGKSQKFFSKEFVQGALIGLLVSLIGFLIWFKFFSS